MLKNAARAQASMAALSGGGSCSDSALAQAPPPSSPAHHSGVPPVAVLERFALFALFDGHGGCGASQLLQQKMHMALVTHKYSKKRTRDDFY